MKIKFLKNASGAVNGVSVKEYKINDICSVNGVEIDKELTDAFLKRGIAEIYNPEVKANFPEIENKAITPDMQETNIQNKYIKKGKK